MEVPQWLIDRMRAEGGVNHLGGPLFRVMWAGTLTCIVGGNWQKYDENENIIGSVVEERRVLKYPLHAERFVFEQWMAPESFGSPEEWERNTVTYVGGKKIYSLGEFPHQGEYELVKVLETPTTHQFIPLTSTLCDALIQTARANKGLPVRQRMQMIKDQRERDEKAKEQKKKDSLGNIARPWWTADAHVVCPEGTEEALITIPDDKEMRAYGK
jgi:hypothetical protein